MRVTVMDIREMPVAVDHGRMAMNMDMRFAGWIQRSVPVAMMLVVNMAVFVHQRVVPVLVLMLLDEVEINAEPHESDGNRKL